MTRLAARPGAGAALAFIPMTADMPAFLRPGLAVAPRAAVFALALLVGCAPAAPPPLPAPRPEALIPGPSGLSVNGTGMEIGFGRAQPGAVAAASRLLGPPASRGACGGEPGEPGEVVRWVSGLALHFPEGGLSGWEQEGRSAGRLCRTSR